jgi:integrase
VPARGGLQIHEWPERDQRAWGTAVASSDFFATDARASHWAKKTRYQASSAYGRWLDFLDRTCPDALQKGPAQRATRGRLTAYVDEVSQRVAAMSVVAEINHLRMALWAIAPGIDLGWLAEVQRRWSRLAKPRERRNRMVDARRLYALGLTLMATARVTVDPLTAARDFRDGLLIALLVSRPLRRKNLAELDVGIHLLKVGAGYLLSIAGDATKSGQPLEFDVPVDLVPYLADYLASYRNRFPNADGHAALWPSTKGGRLGAGAIYLIVCKRTRAAFGCEISPHLFRSVAATTLVREAPAQSLVASDLLGHAKPDTTDQYYTRSRTIEASRQHSRLIEQLRKQSRR